MLLVHSILGRFLLSYWDVSFVHLNSNTQEEETSAVKVQFTLKETNQCQPMVYDWYNESVIRQCPLLSTYSFTSSPSMST